MKSIHEIDSANPKCNICHGEGLVCENHPTVKWNGGDGHIVQKPSGQYECGGAGMPCECNPLHSKNKSFDLSRDRETH